MTYEPGHPVIAKIGQSVKFVVTSPKGLRSSTWVVKAGSNSRDVYVGTADSMGEVKLSCHVSGHWQLAYTRQHADADGIDDRVMARFPPSSSEIRPGWTHVATVMIPASSLRKPVVGEAQLPSKRESRNGRREKVTHSSSRSSLERPTLTLTLGIPGSAQPATSRSVTVQRWWCSLMRSRCLQRWKGACSANGSRCADLWLHRTPTTSTPRWCTRSLASEQNAERTQSFRSITGTPLRGGPWLKEIRRAPVTDKGMSAPTLQLRRLI